jgi:hypothetical protein
MSNMFFELDFRYPDFQSSAGSSWVSLLQHPQEDGDFLHITIHCACLSEIEWQIDRMQKELEAVRREARRKYDAVLAAPPKSPFA